MNSHRTVSRHNPAAECAIRSPGGGQQAPAGNCAAESGLEIRSLPRPPRGRRPRLARAVPHWRQTRKESDGTQNPRTLRALGALGLFGAIFPIFADVISWFLAEDYNPLARSISALAVGPSSWLMDAGLWAFVLACFSVAAGLWMMHVEARYWTGALISLVLLGIDVGVIAGVNDHAGTQNIGANVHAWAVYFIAFLFAAVAFLTLPGLKRISDKLSQRSLWLGILWIILGIVYLWFVPNGWSGAVERALALVMLIWLGSNSRILRDGDGPRTTGLREGSIRGADEACASQPNVLYSGDLSAGNELR